MKAVVIYDSQFGNTAQIARAVAEGLLRAAADGTMVDLYNVSEVQPQQLAGLDMLVVGSPTQKFRPTLPIKQLLKGLPKNALKGVTVAAFDTRLTEEEINSHGVLTKFVDIFGYAAEPVADGLKKKGGQEAAPPTGFYVSGTEGPLVAGELERAEAWGAALMHGMAGEAQTR